MAVAITRKILGPDEAIDEMVIADAMGEIVNVIGGAAKPALRALGQRGLVLSLPTVVKGGSHVVFRKDGLQSWLALFDSELGKFSVQVFIGKEPEEKAAA